jgi:hypothetical protein
MKLGPQAVRNVGLSYVRNQLTRRGWKVMPPTGNAKGVDFLILSQDASRKLTIKVRAFSQRKGPYIFWIAPEANTVRNGPFEQFQ